jgi:hypothetical protein
MKIFNFFPKVLALIAVLLLVLRSMMVADGSWDTLSYHLPFAAMRAGLLSPDNFVLSSPLAAAYLGFPSAIYYLKGFLWSVTGKAEASQLVSILSVIIFALFAKKTLRIPTEWLLIGVLSIPAIQIGATANMTDVPANMGMAMMFLSLYKLIIQPTQLSKSDLLWLLIACLVTSGSKPQAVIVGCFLFAGYLSVFFWLKKSDVIQYNELLTKKTAIFGLVFSVIAISYPALVNLYSYQNPIYPMDVKIAGIHLKGVFGANSWPDPAYLNTLPQQVRWMLSVLELNAFDLRPLPYMPGQGDVPRSAKSFTMGGYFSPLILMSLFVIILTTIKKVRREYVRGLLLLAVATFFIAFLPGSNELRYYSFWAVSLVAIAINQLESNKDDLELKGVLLTYKSFLVVSFVFIAFITGGEYFKWQGLTYAELANTFPKDRLVIHTDTNTTYCYMDDFRGAIFDSAVFSDSTNVVMGGVKYFSTSKHDICKKAAQ